MKKITRLTCAVVILVTVLAGFNSLTVTHYVFAEGAGSGNTGTGAGSGNTGTGAGSGNTGTGAGSGNTVNLGDIHLDNPLKAKSLQCLLYDVVNGVIDILAILAALYIIYSGFMFVAAQGKPEELKKAKNAFFNALIGTAILLGAWAITSFVVNVVNQVVQPGTIPGIPSSTSCNN